MSLVTLDPMTQLICEVINEMRPAITRGHMISNGDVRSAIFNVVILERRGKITDLPEGLQQLYATCGKKPSSTGDYHTMCQALYESLT